MLGTSPLFCRARFGSGLNSDVAGGGRGNCSKESSGWAKTAIKRKVASASVTVGCNFSN